MLPSNVQALRDKKSNWSLAEDRQLRSALEEINSSLTAKIKDVSDAIEENSLKIANACVQVSNLNNRLSLFAADQFIESRVGDDASVCANSALNSHTINPNKQAGATDNLHQAVSMGLELMRTRFKRIDIRPEDLDEDDDLVDTPKSVFEPYDENLIRPLPFLIGSSDWNSSSSAISLEECAETAKVTKEVVISLPPFTQPRMAECKDLSHADALDGKPACVISNRTTSNTKDVEAVIATYSNEYNSDIYTPQTVVTTSSSQASLLKEKEVENTSDFVFNLPRNEESRRYSEAPVMSRDSVASVEHLDPEVSHRPPDLKVSTGPPESELPVKKIWTAGTVKDQAKKQTTEESSNSMGKLFVDSSSDEDDLFSDLKNTSAKANRFISTYSNDSQVIPISGRGKTDLQMDKDVPNSDVFSDVLKSKKPLKAADYIFVNDAETSGAFRNKLDSIFSNKIMSNTNSNMEKRQAKETAEDRTKNDETSAILPSLAKLRAKGPSRRSPSHLSQHSDKKVGSDKVKSISTSAIISASAEDNAAIRTKAELRQDSQLKMDLTKHIIDKVNNAKQRNDISSIFSSDSDDDIFSFSNKSKTSAPVSKSQVRNEKLQSLPSSREHPSITSESRSQIPKFDSKLKNLFDSDDEDIFASSFSVKKQGQKSIRNREGILGKEIHETVIPKKDESVLEKRETVIPRKANTLKPKRADIFGDDSDGDLFS
ncbi:WASH complex subunit [Dirofilaria immitis]